MPKKAKLGSGARFKALAEKTSPAIAAAIAIKKYGQKKVTAMAVAGKKRKAKNK